MAWNGSDSGGASSAGFSTQRSQRGEDAKGAKGPGEGRAPSRPLAKGPGGRIGDAPLPSGGNTGGHASLWRGAAALALVVVGGAVWWWVGGHAGRVTLPDGRIGDAPLPRDARSGRGERPARPSEPVPCARGDAGEAAPTAATDDGLPPHKRIVETLSVVTNADGSVLTRFRTADGKTRSRQSAPKPVFDNASDQMIALAVSGAASGGSMPPMPAMDGADEAFAKSLEKEIVIGDDDPERVKALKREVMAVREEMRQLIAEGRSFADVMREHRDMVNRNAELRKEATRILEEFVESGDADGARELLEKINAALDGAGVDGVDMPMAREERRAAIRERKAGSK